jgi:hypothetical protein
VTPRALFLILTLVAPAFAGSEPELPPVIRAADLALLGAVEPRAPQRAPVPALPSPDPAANSPVPTAIAPDRDGVVDLVSAGERRDADPRPNPFRVRIHPPPAVREVPLSVQATLRTGGAGGASAVINGETCSAGDRVGELVVEAIGADSVTLRRGPILIEVPVREEPVVLRLPR